MSRTPAPARQPLHDGWSLRVVHPTPDVPAELHDRVVPATVPGCVHTDLLAAGLIGDPYFDQHELTQQWIGHNDWRYTCTFDADEATRRREHVDLVCEGLDTVATIELNGQPIGRTQNMHRTHRLPVKALLKPTGNELTITFASPVKHARAERDRLGELPRVFYEPFNFIRKMACNFGWDWGPVLTTSGIWRPIRLEGWGSARIEHVRPLVMSADAKRARLAVHADVAWSGDGGKPLRVNATLSGPDGSRHEAAAEVKPGEKCATLTIDIDKPALWWPRGYGEQPLYDLHVTLEDADEWRGRVGLRTVELDTSPDDIGSRFTLKVNGQAVFCKGANWIPDDCFVHRVDADRYRQRVQQAVDANMNLLRVWGGGVYADEAFYRACDEAGVLVWQDFLFACAMYPEAAPLPEEIEAEAREHIARLSQHPSLVLWCGGNENVMAYQCWDQFNNGKLWRDSVGDRPWGADYYMRLLPGLIEELDPTRPYWPSSPYSGSPEQDATLDTHGNQHIWDAWFGGNHERYREHVPRFVSEFGFQAPPSYTNLHHYLPREQWSIESAAMQHRQRHPECHGRIAGYAAEFLAPPRDFHDWLYLTQLYQARALSVGIEWFRAQQPVCMGTVYWQFNDCWPATSWAALDWPGRPRLLWHATRRFYADRLITVQPNDEGAPTPHLINDTAQPWRGMLALSRRAFDGRVLASQTRAFKVPPRGCVRMPALDGELVAADPTSEFILVEADGRRAFWFFERDKALAYPEPAFDAELDAQSNRHRLTLTAKTLLRDVALYPDALAPGAQVHDQLVTLLPGERFTFEIDSPRPLTLNDLTQPPVLQCANRFGRDHAEACGDASVESAAAG